MPSIRQRSLRAAVATLFVPLVLAAAAPHAALAAEHAHAVAAVNHSVAFDAWADRFAADWVRLNPMMATSTQYFSGTAEQETLDRQLTPFTTAQRQKMVALAKVGVARLDKFLAASLDDNQRISAATMRWTLANAIANEQFDDYNFIFNQFSGVQISLVNFMTQTHPLRRASDVANYLARLEQVSTRIDEALARAKAAEARSLIPPRFILERAQDQVDNFLKPEAAQNVFVTSLDKRMQKVADLSPQARAEAVARATRIVEERIRPAYARVQKFMAELYPHTTHAAGISRLPNGAAAYAQDLAYYNNTHLTAGQIHAIGLREVARIEGEMDKHLRSLGFTEGSIKDRMAQLDEKYQPKGEADPRPALLAKYEAIVKDALVRSDALFDQKPKAPVQVLREPPLTEAAAAAHYTLPAPDGSRPGTFWVPLPGPKFEIAGMRSLSYHEAVPGHHFQLAIQQELTGLPKYRALRVFGGGSAHSEGWALYAERLAVENGWYEGDEVGLLGALDSELFRARRLVVDTGLHAQGWTREQAIDFGINAQEVERYVAWPGQATAYMLGMLRIVELRDKAKAELGAKFSLPAFHDVVLRTGSVPMEVLADVVDRWIASQKKS